MVAKKRRTRVKVPESREIRRQKILEAALESDPVDFECLRNMSLGTGGLMTESLRRRVWPRLVGLNPFSVSNFEEDIYEHPEYTQVELDIRRSLGKYTKDMRSNLRKEWQEKLGRIVHGVHSRNPGLHYFQGFHDICTIFLLTCGEDMGFQLSEKVAQNHFRSAMEKDFQEIMKQMELLFPLIGCVDKELHAFLIDSGVQPFFALSWVITWFSHNIDDVSVMARLFDFFLVSHPIMPIYVSAQAVIQKREEVLRRECEFTVIHHYLANIGKDLDYEPLLGRARSLFHEFPPTCLENEGGIRIVPARYLKSEVELFPWFERGARSDTALLKETLRLQKMGARPDAQGAILSGHDSNTGEDTPSWNPRMMVVTLGVFASMVASTVLMGELGLA